MSETQGDKRETPDPEILNTKLMKKKETYMRRPWHKVALPTQFERWRKFKADWRIRSDDLVAKYLLDSYENYL